MTHLFRWVYLVTPQNAELERYYFIAFADGSERPILIISKILSATQRRYSQIQKEALILSVRFEEISSVSVRS